jgi:hypothetical protein
MNDHPILMSGPMVRALLDGSKTQTRRIVKPQPTKDADLVNLRWEISPEGYQHFCRTDKWWDESGNCTDEDIITCPYGKSGDSLWVRETWQLHSRATDVAKVVYRASERASHTEFHEFVPVSLIGNTQPKPFQQGWRPSIHMPRWASRMTLELTEVRVERLQEITEEDAKAEGMFFTDYGRKCFHRASPPQDVGDCPAPQEHHPQRDGWMWDRTTSSDQCLGSARSAYWNLWNTINSADSWNADPWVWVLSFRIHQKNVDVMLGRRVA